jgi:hypothetical protein
VSLNSSTELAVVAADGRLFQSRMDLGKKEFRSSIWDPYNTGQINQLEKVQRRAARFTTKNYTDRQPGSVTQMVTQLGWEPLQVRRVKIRGRLFHSRMDLGKKEFR